MNCPVSNVQIGMSDINQTLTLIDAAVIFAEYAGGTSALPVRVSSMSKCLVICIALLVAASVALSAAASEKILWTSDLDAAMARAKSDNKPVMIDFVADWCGPCKSMDASTFSDATVIQKAQAFIPVRIDIDKQKEIAAKYNGLARAYGGAGIPNILFLSKDGIKIKQIIGFKTAGQLLSEMNSALKPRK